MDENEMIEETVEETEDEIEETVEETEEPAAPSADYAELIVKIDSLAAKMDEIAAGLRNLGNAKIPPAATTDAVKPSTLY